MVNAHKIHTNGNDFLVIESDDPALKQAAFVQKIADRHYGIGCDQVLFTAQKDNHTLCQFYNQDGSKANLCLNGVYAVANHLPSIANKKRWHINTPMSTISTEGQENHNAINIPTSILQQCEKKTIANLPLGPGHINTFFVDVGNQHLIFAYQDSQSIDLKELGHTLQQHPDFPNGINVSIYHQSDAETLQIRTYERGVGPTLSCGSAALSVFLTQEKQQKWQLRQPGGLTLLHRHSCHIAMQASSQYVATVKLLGHQ